MVQQPFHRFSRPCQDGSASSWSNNNWIILNTSSFKLDKAFWRVVKWATPGLPPVRCYCLGYFPLSPAPKVRKMAGHTWVPLSPSELCGRAGRQKYDNHLGKKHVSLWVRHFAAIATLGQFKSTRAETIFVCIPTTTTQQQQQPNQWFIFRDVPLPTKQLNAE